MKKWQCNCKCLPVSDKQTEALPITLSCLPTSCLWTRTQKHNNTPKTVEKNKSSVSSYFFDEYPHLLALTLLNLVSVRLCWFKKISPSWDLSITHCAACTASFRKPALPQWMPLSPIQHAQAGQQLRVAVDWSVQALSEADILYWLCKNAACVSYTSQKGWINLTYPVRARHRDGYKSKDPAPLEQKHTNGSKWQKETNMWLINYKWSRSSHLCPKLTSLILINKEKHSVATETYITNWWCVKTLVFTTVGGTL